MHSPSRCQANNFRPNNFSFGLFYTTLKPNMSMGSFEKFKELPLLGILRDVKKSQISSLFQASYDAGLRYMEIALNTKDALHLILLRERNLMARLKLGQVQF